MMPFLTTRPTSRMRPIADETLRSVPVSQQQQQRAAERQRRRQQDQQRRQPGAELDDEDRRTPAARRARTPAAARGTPPLRLVLAADLVGVADRQRQLSRAARGSRRRRCRGRGPRGARSRAPSAAGSRACSSACPFGALHRRDRRQRHRRAVGRADAACRPAAPDRSGRRRAGGRAPASCDRAGAARSATSPSQSPAIWSRHLLHGQAVARRPPPDRSSTSPRDCRAARRRRRRRRRPCSSIVLDRLGELRQAFGIVAEDLHLDRLGAALEVAEHVLQQLHELDVDERRRLVHALAQVVDDLLGRSRSRWPRGFRRTRMSPVFCAVANSPSSDPVRRE